MLQINQHVMSSWNVFWFRYLFCGNCGKYHTQYRYLFFVLLVSNGIWYIYCNQIFYSIYSLFHILFDSWISLLYKLVIIETWVKNHRILKQEILNFACYLDFLTMNFYILPLWTKKKDFQKYFRRYLPIFNAYSAYNDTNHIIICINKP